MLNSSKLMGTHLLLFTLFGSSHGISLLNSTNITFNSACEKGVSYPAVYLEHEPFIFTEANQDGGQVKGFIHEIFEHAVQSCCNKSTRVSYRAKGPYSSVVDLVDEHRAELVLPVGRRVGKTDSVLGRHFVPLLESPGLAVVIKQSISGADLMAAIFQSWPIIVFIVMSLALAGVCVWFLERRVNSDEFPQFFPRGIFEGFWWASVTMTTVGYGDKVPKSVLGRLFAVVWINVGLVILAVFMGIITTSLTSSSMENVSNLYGLPTSVINASSEHQIAILYNTDVYAKQNYDELYRSVSEGETQLALVDVYSTTRHKRYFSRYKLHIATVMSEPVVYGLAIPSGEKRGFNCLSRYYKSHEVEVHQTLERYLVISKRESEEEEEEEGGGLDYFNGSAFGYTIYIMAGLFVIALFSGLIWQYKFRAVDQQQGCQSNTPIKAIADVKYRDQLPTKPENHSCDERPMTQTNRGLLTRHATPLVIPENKRQPTKGRPGTERVMAQHSAEVLRMDEDMKAFKKNWERKFRVMQEKHRREQMELFELENEGYEIQE